MFSNPIKTVEGENSVYAKMLSENSMLSDHYNNCFGVPEYRHDFTVEKIKTGIPSFDSITGGGLAEGTLSVLRGAPGAGKTTLATQICKNIAVSGQPVIYFGCEDNFYRLRTKMLTQELFLKNNLNPAKIPTTSEQFSPATYIHFPQELWSDIYECHRKLCVTMDYGAKETYKSNYIYVDCSNMSARDIVKFTKFFCDYTGVKPVVVVDYLQRLKAIDSYSGNGAEKAALDESVHMMKEAAVSLNIAVVVLGSIGKTFFQKPAELDADEGSNQILHTADNMFALYTPGGASKKKSGAKEASDNAAPSDGDSYREISLKILKHRNGPLAEISLHYYPSMDYFDDHCAPPDMKESLVDKRYFEIKVTDPYTIEDIEISYDDYLVNNCSPDQSFLHNASENDSGIC